MNSSVQNISIGTGTTEEDVVDYCRNTMHEYFESAKVISDERFKSRALEDKDNIKHYTELIISDAIQHIIEALKVLKKDKNAVLRGVIIEPFNLEW